MKRFFAMLMVVLTIGVLGTSCDGKKPEFKFQVDVSGKLAIPESQVVSNFSSYVSNTTTPVLLSASTVEQITEVSPRIVADAEDYFESQIKATLPPSAYYDITIKGYVTENLTGITVAVNKTFKSWPDGVELIEPPVEVNEADSIVNF